MNNPHEYKCRIPTDVWSELLDIKKITNKSINLILIEGSREMLRKTKQELPQLRRDRETIRTVSSVI